MAGDRGRLGPAGCPFGQFLPSSHHLGTVKLTSTTATCGVIATPNASGRCRNVPRNERARAQKSLMAGTELMSSNGEQVANRVVNREEPLGLCHRFESPHVALARSGRLVGDFGPVVGVAGGVVD